jgi:hypothetical protein
MKRLKQLIITLPVVAGLLAPAAALATAHAQSYSTPDRTNVADTAAKTHLTTLKTKGDAEIARRLATLNRLIAVITSAGKLSENAKETLRGEVSNEITGLATLRIKLGNETTVADAAADVSSMITEYRVYALVAPKVQLIKAADEQQAVEKKLADLGAKLATRLTSAKDNGKDVAALQSKFDEMASHVTAAQSISSDVETSVLALQPTDYNSDHAVLGSYRDKLKTARTNIQTAYSLAKEIVTGLKKL